MVVESDNINAEDEAVLPVLPDEIVVVREGPQWRNLGMLVSHGDEPMTLIIDEIDEYSLVGEWNQKQESGMKVPTRA